MKAVSSLILKKSHTEPIDIQDVSYIERAGSMQFLDCGWLVLDYCVYDILEFSGALRSHTQLTLTPAIMYKSNVTYFCYVYVIL